MDLNRARKGQGVRFPQKIKRGSITVTVYRVANAGTSSGWLYQVCWSSGDGKRKRSGFADYAEAHADAVLKAEQLAAGRIVVASRLNGDQVGILSEARRICGSTPIIAALEEWHKARELCGGDLIPAARLWRDTHAGATENVTVKEAVARFIDSKKKAGIDTGASYEHCLGRLELSLGSHSLASVTTVTLQKWLEQIKHPVSRNTHRKRIVALWRWSRRQGLLPRVAETEADRTERAREEDQEIGILTLADWKSVLALVKSKQPDFLAVTVLAGFCGLRRSELHTQKWTDINLERGFVRVTRAKRNTPSKRLVHLCPAAIEWLMECDRSESLISPKWGIDRVRKVAREAGLNLPENGFRHSFISYRVALTGNVAETALEAGNGPQIVHKHYRELAPKKDGEAWFNFRPSTSLGEVVEMNA